MAMRVSSAAQGASMGSMFGPVGAVVGGALGSLLGGSDYAARKKAERKQSEQAYGIVEQSFEYLSEGRRQAEGTYQSNLASARARHSGSGARLEGTGWEQVRGEVLRKREEALADYSIEEEKFRQGEGYKLFTEDYGRMTSLVGSDKEKGEGYRQYSIRAEGFSGESIFTEAQRKTLHRFSAGERGINVSTYREYASRLAPGIEAYERARFGTAEDRETFEADMSTRISDANTWYERQIQEQRIRNANRARFSGDDRR